MKTTIIYSLFIITLNFITVVATYKFPIKYPGEYQINFAKREIDERSTWVKDSSLALYVWQTILSVFLLTLLVSLIFPKSKYILPISENI